MKWLGIWVLWSFAAVAVIELLNAGGLVDLRPMDGGAVIAVTVLVLILMSRRRPA